MKKNASSHKGISAIVLVMFIMLSILPGLLKGQIIFHVTAPSNLSGPYTFNYAQTGWGHNIDTMIVNEQLVFALDGTVEDSLVCDNIGGIVNSAAVTGKIAVVYRGSCEFGIKALNVQNAGAIGVIIINNVPGPPQGMGPGSVGSQVNIPVVMISKTDGALLKPAIDAGTAVALIGNKTGFFPNDVGAYIKDIVIAKTWAIPSDVAVDSNAFKIPVGAWITNYGQNNQTGVTLNAIVSLNSNILYNETSTGVNINSGDSVYISLNDFTQASYSDGIYKLEYTISSTATDDWPHDNNLTSKFWIQPNHYSKSSWDTITFQPLSTGHYRSSNLDPEFEWCIVVDQPSQDILVDGISFSATGLLSLAGISIEATIYEWNDVITNTLTFDSLSTILSNEFFDYVDNSLAGSHVTINFPFPVHLTNKKYLACVKTYDNDVFIGADEKLDYKTAKEAYNPNPFQFDDLNLFFPYRSGPSLWNGPGFDFNGVPSIVLNVIPFNSSAALTSVSPNKGGNTGMTMLNVVGSGFATGIQVKLTKTGYPDIIIPDSTIEVVNVAHLRAPLNLIGADTGYWNVVVNFPGGTILSLPNSFLAEQGQIPSVNVNILGPPLFRFNQWQNYHVLVTNNSNTTAFAVPLFIAVPNTLEIDYDLGNRFFLPSDSLLYDTIHPYIIADNLFTNNPDTFYLFPLVISHVNPGETINYKIKVKSSTAGQYLLKAWAGRSFFSTDSTYFSNQSPNTTCFEDAEKIECIRNATFLVTGTLPGSTCVEGSVYNLFNSMMGNPCNIPATRKANNFLETITETILECIPQSTVSSALNNAKEILTLLSKDSLIQECALAFQNPNSTSATIFIASIGSWDPNEKYGPQGVNAGNFLNTNFRLPYQIVFENVDSATAAAQIVIVIDTLDQNVYDISTFELGFVSIADSVYLIPPGNNYYEMDIYLGPVNDIIARMQGGLDITTGVATWTFTSIDPATMQPTTDPLAGFLPPNVIEPEGEGGVFFTIKTWDTLSTNTVIKNKAYIYFDSNPPIITNEWLNTNDNIKPVSQMNALSPVIIGDSSVLLTWSGSDIGSGVNKYRIYYSVNSGPYSVLASNISDTSYVFYGNYNTSYSFFSIALDSVGNIEDMKTVAEATTSFIVNINDINNLNNIEVSVFPNPNQGNFNISINTIKAGIFDFQITDISGRKIFGEKIKVATGNTIIPLTIIDAGIYFIKIENKEEQRVNKIVVTKK
ncbi:MAG: PA domain-containing protein [Bacteroidia bacterium]